MKYSYYCRISLFKTSYVLGDWCLCFHVTTLALHVYFLRALSGKKMRRSAYSFIYNLEGEMCQENKEGEKDDMCKAKESRKGEICYFREKCWTPRCYRLTYHV